MLIPLAILVIKEILAAILNLKEIKETREIIGLFHTAS